MGRKKIQIDLIKNDSKKRVTFNKRAVGICKKCYQLGKLCDKKVAFVVMDDTNELQFYGYGVNAKEFKSRVEKGDPLVEFKISRFRKKTDPMVLSGEKTVKNINQ